MNMHIVHKLNRMARENEAIGELEEHSTPMFYTVIVCLVMLVAGQCVDSYADAKHAGSIKTASVMADCMNGKAINADGSIMRCEVVSYALVRGVK